MMEVFVLGICAVLCFVLIGILAWEKIQIRLADFILNSGEVDPEEEVNKHEQIEVFRTLGITFANKEAEYAFIRGCSVEDNEYLASHPYYGLCIQAGTGLSRIYSPGDMECVYEETCYGDFLKQLVRISALPLVDIEGYDTFFVRFSIKGQTIAWHAKENSDWLDECLPAFLNKIIEKHLPEDASRFYMDDLHEAPIYYFGTKEEATHISRRTGLVLHRV